MARTCAWETCDMEIPEEWKLYTYDWGILYRNVEKNEFAHRHNSKEGAAKISAMQRTNAPGPKPTELADAILASLHDPDNEKKQVKARDLLITAAASVASRGNAQSIQALTILSDQIGQAFSTRMSKPRPGEICPLCDRSDEAQIQLVMAKNVFDWMGEIDGDIDEMGAELDDA